MSAQEQKTAAELAAETQAVFERKFDAIKGLAENALGKAETGEQLAAETKSKIDEALVEFNGVSAKLSELQQQIDREGGSAGGEAKSLGQRFAESDEFKAFEADGFGRNSKARFESKATLTNATSDAAGSVGAGAAVTRVPGVNMIANRRMTVIDLIMPGRMDGNSLEYIKETGFTNSAAPVAEGGAAPQSDIKLAEVTGTAKTMAHTIKASRQALSDQSALASMVDGRLRYGLDFVKETQVLNGDGIGQNLNGLVTQATAFSAEFAVTAETQIDKMRLAMLQAALAEYPATGHILNPIDWAVIETLKDSENKYIVGNPQGQLAPTLWGLPVVATQAMAADKFLTGAFMLGAQYFQRWETVVETGYENDDFTKNLVTMMASERGFLAVYRPEAFIYGDLGRVG